MHSNFEPEAWDCVVTSEPEDVYVDSATRSPSTDPKSILSQSSHSRHNSSESSNFPGPGHNSSLPALQIKGGADYDGLEPLAEEEIDPASFDLVVPAHALGKQYSLETQSELLFSVKHLGVIFEDPLLLQRFTNFLYSSRPRSVPLLVYYLDALKALKAINYANAVTAALNPIEGLDYTESSILSTVNNPLQERADKAFETLANHDLPAYITHTYVQTVSLTIKRRISDTLPLHLRDMSEGLAEVFCLTDPSRPDSPIVFASEEFHKTTQYGMNYVLGRNCRFLQGPKTNPFSVRRIREKLDAGQEHCETFLNYRRDGSPFMNLLMIAPLYDSRGIVRYHIGAQVDVSGLVKECSGLESLERLMAREMPQSSHPADIAVKTNGEDEQGKKDEFRELTEMFSLQELKTVREAGGSLHRVHQQEIHQTEGVLNWHKPRLLIRDDATIGRKTSDPMLDVSANIVNGGRLSGVYEHYLLVRPHPSLRILFASPSLRVPGMLQSSFMSRIGGSGLVRDALGQAFADGHGVTAKVRWLSRSSQSVSNGRSRWIHCTPLLGSNGAVGVWMVVLIDDEESSSKRTARDAPPVKPTKRIQRQFDDGQSTDGDNMSLSSFAAAHRAVDEVGGFCELRSEPESGAGRGEVEGGHGGYGDVKTPSRTRKSPAPQVHFAERPNGFGVATSEV
ncbi:uncharacterized protein BCR38DRAFT_329200 [Pseudomassariella vexata]|uniref:PAS domain-containing protein n=1 Tax=Pseudomassariella vexata TaxID=1141098 RepID=A0A1Y2EHV9_9PEZI|nr:uncharacterized protein BCR38DRAFT_329200 [Pseudomassariella vexata]ORY71161.1 hypothetical protein BCR38DRAFT_329200 [Pseudomassariella vexata]